jgi:hypothetical protein
MLKALWRPFVPNKVVLLRPDGDAPPITKLAAYTKTQTSSQNQPTAYVCQNFACKLPTTEHQQDARLSRRWQQSAADWEVAFGGSKLEWQKAFNDKILYGELDYQIEGKRVDILTPHYAVEVDWLHKWKEGVSQALKSL